MYLLMDSTVYQSFMVSVFYAFDNYLTLIKELDVKVLLVGSAVDKRNHGWQYRG